jgi:hypothetical protein
MSISAKAEIDAMLLRMRASDPYDPCIDRFFNSWPTMF